MLKRLFSIIRLYILRINIYIFPDKRDAIEPTEKDYSLLDDTKRKSEVIFFKGSTENNEDKFNNRNVLLGVFRNITQFDICLLHNFYYIPYELVEGTEEKLRYIALYQSKNLFGYDAGVKYYGKISSYEIIPREEIEEVFSENEGLYCRFAVDEWIELENIIYPREIGFIREFTTMFLLKNSREVPQLFIETMREFELYNAVSLAVEYRQKITFGNLSMFTRKGFLLIFNGSRLTHFYPEKEFRIRPGATVKNMIKDLGL